MKKRLTYPAFALALLLLQHAGCREPTRVKVEKPHIIFLLIDAIRNDHLSCYGYHWNTTPVIDELASGGTLFENAIAQSPWTAPSMASLFTSRRPMAVGVHAIESKSGMRYLKKGLVTVLDDKHKTLAEILKENGYATIAVTTNGLSSHHVNMVQGFDVDSYHVYKKGNVVISRSIELLQDFTDPGSPHCGKPIFLYVHFIDVHEPNQPAPPFDKLFPTLDSGPHTKKHAKWGHYKIKDPNDEAFRIFKSHKTALYDGALTFVDDQIGRLVDAMKELGLYDNSVIVIASDHGEELWDHALIEQTYRKDPRNHYGIGHGHTMFAELLNVPLIFSGKGVPAGARIKTQVRNSDISPTLLGLAGVDQENAGLEGVDLIEKMKTRTLTDLIAFSEDIIYGYEEKCVQDNRYKYIRGRDYEFLFDKQKDPLETKNLASKLGQTKNKFAKILDEILESTDEQHGDPITVNDEIIEQLRKLGYMR